MDIAHLREWIGRTQSADDVAAAGQIEGLAALLDHREPPWNSGELPPLAHWLYFLARARQSEIDTDGHPRRGSFLPPIALPRRMWAGSRVWFLAPIVVGEAMTRRSTIIDVRERTGTSGGMIFVSIRHEIATANGTALAEEQDIVFRQAPTTTGAPRKQMAVTPRLGTQVRRVQPDATQLFRFSALTFNAHRIHYDRDYARTIEGYPGLVVQGPYTAMLLMDHFLRSKPRSRVASFDFRATLPLFDTAPFDLCLSPSSGGAALWALDSEGREAMVASVAAA